MVGGRKVFCQKTGATKIQEYKSVAVFVLNEFWHAKLRGDKSDLVLYKREDKKEGVGFNYVKKDLVLNIYYFYRRNFFGKIIYQEPEVVIATDTKNSPMLAPILKAIKKVNHL
jgi:NMD protein affecting ribosome stability and mRNA decay